LSARALYLAAYDVADDARRRAALVLIKAYATGGQKSFYEIFLTDGEKADLFHDVALVLDETEDRFFLLRLDPRSRVHTLGVGVEPADDTYFYFG
jgi:CRISPR-associated protein Cas2